MLCAFQVEIVARELDGVLYQALHFASRGLPTLIGDRMANVYVMRSDKPIIYIDQDQQKVVNDHVIDNGGVVLNLHSEGQGFVDDSPQMQKNFAGIIHHVTQMCTWGVRQTEILSEIVPEEMYSRMVVTGHPSFDLVSPQFTPYFRNEDIVREHGEDYILINTSFGMFNHEMGFEAYVRMLSRMEEWKVYGDESHRAYLEKVCANQEKVALAMIELAEDLSRNFPKRHIIIRPHPAENSEFYASRFRDTPTVFVSKKGSVREWIATADAVIHHDCTTGMEAFLMGKTVLQFDPYEGLKSTAPLMTQIGIHTKNSEEAISHIEAGHIPEDTVSRLKEMLFPYLANIKQNASREIAKVASGYANDSEYWMPKKLGFWENIKCWRKYVSKLIRAKQPGRNGRKVRYALNKFPRISQDEIQNRIDRLREVEPELPEISIEQLCLNTFLIKPRQ